MSMDATHLVGDMIPKETWYEMPFEGAWVLSDTNTITLFRLQRVGKLLWKTARYYKHRLIDLKVIKSIVTRN